MHTMLLSDFAVHNSIRVVAGRCGGVTPQILRNRDKFGQHFSFLGKSLKRILQNNLMKYANNNRKIRAVF